MAKKASASLSFDDLISGLLQVDPSKMPPKPGKRTKQTGKPATKTKPVKKPGSKKA